eukprot:3163821-Prymnesium_polylepis.1
MLGRHAAVLRHAAGSTLVLDRDVASLRARQTARECLARSRVHGHRPTDALRGSVRGRHVYLCRMSCAWVLSMSAALVGPHASMPDDVRLSGR